MMKLSTYSFKQLLSGGSLCCLILLGAYIFQAFFPEMYIDAFSSSMHLLMWLILFVGALLWTFRAKGERFRISEVIGWQFITAFILITADEIYMIMPRENHIEIVPALSEHTIPVLAVVGIMIASTIKVTTALYQRLMDERRQTFLQTQKKQQLLDSFPTKQNSITLVRKLMENQPIAQFSAKDYLLLIEECQIIDPDFFAWLKKLGCHLPPRDIVLCVLIRMYKTKEEIVAIFCITDGTYRTMRSRARKRLGLADEELDVFLQTELK